MHVEKWHFSIELLRMATMALPLECIYMYGSKAPFIVARPLEAIATLSKTCQGLGR
jgi:hypothetical protein